MQSKFQGDAPTQEASNDAQSKKLTFGEKAVGTTFNPGKNEKVEAIKRNFANLIDGLEELRNPPNAERHPEISRMYSIAITELKTAQMWAVKAATWQY